MRISKLSVTARSGLLACCFVEVATVVQYAIW